MRKILLKLVFILSLGILFGQNAGNPFQNDITEKHMPKTPSERAFEKFVNIPEGNYTGVHGFSVPIYTIQGDDFSFPISIDYSGGGIKVDEISGVVGLGWNINIGGISLSQEIRGLPDGNNSNGGISIEDPLSFDPNTTNYFDAINMVGRIAGIAYGSCVDLMPGVDSNNEVNPDYFSYSLLNDSGRFIMDSEGGFHTIPKDDIEIVNKTYLIDSKGIKYYFYGYKSLDTFYYASTMINLFSYSYRLDKIVFPQGDVMTFSYIKNIYKYVSNYEFTQDLQLNFNNSSVGESIGQSKKTPYLTTSSEYLISSVEYKNTLINFTYLNEDYNLVPREDVNGGASLDKIEVYFKPDNESAQLRKSYKFTTDYFRSGLGNTNELYTNSDYPVSQYLNRLKLKSIEELLSLSKYSFEYEGERTMQNGSNIDLPHRFSYSTDDWGVFNGSNNISPIETFTYVLKNSNPLRDVIVWGGNKQPSKNHAIIGNLRKVHLPTGGFQEFEYELDEYYNENELVPENHYFKRENMTEHMFWHNSVNYNSWSTFATLDINDMPNFDFRDGIDYRIKFNISDAPIDDGGGLPQINHYRVQLFDNLDNEVGPVLIYNNSEEYFLPLLDPNKSYHFKIKYFPGGSPNNQTGYDFIHVNIKLSWAQNNIKYYKNKNAGSLRTKSITLKDSENNDQIKRSYQYTNFHEEEKSGGIFTGRMLGKAVYSLRPCGKSNTNGCTPEYCQFKTFSRSPNHLNLNSIYGKSVFYENVTETFENININSENYKEEYEFKGPSFVGFPVDTPFEPIIYRPHNDYTGGMILKKRLYNNLGSKVKDIENVYPTELDYHFNSESADYLGHITNNRKYALAFGLTASISGTSSCVSQGENCFLSYSFNHNYYYITSAWIKLDKTIEKNYENGVLKMTNTKEYKYDDTYSHINLVSTLSTNSLGQEIKTEFQYNHPYKKDEPTTVIHYENNLPLSVQKTTFYATGLPRYVFAKKGATVLDDTIPSDDLKITYDRYSSSGNLEQYTLENGTPVSIIWGYNGQYPIAKVEGLPYSSVQSEAATLLAASNNGSLNPNSFESLRNKEGALVTSYIYKPLVGVTTIIQPNGQREMYEYDAAGRLKEIKDQDGNVLKKVEYHYQNQP